MEKIILASASKRRIDLLQRLKIPFEIQISDLDEVMDEDCEPSVLVTRLAQQKAYHIAKKNHGTSGTILIAADTIVVFNGKKIGKPKDSDDATRTLQLLCGQTHQVYTGVCVLKIEPSGIVREETFVETTAVTMRFYSQQEIDAYVATGDPLDKAGSYGIQSLGMILVHKIEGDYYNVEGLPVARLFCCLQDFGLDLTKFWFY